MAKYYKYVTIQCDNFDSIALDFYKSEKYSSTIMQANPKYIDVLVFDQGVELKIPIIDQTNSSNLPPWKG